MLWMWLSRIFVNRIFSKICLGSCYLRAKDSKSLSGKMNNHLLFYWFLKTETKKKILKSGTVLQHHCSVDKIFLEYFPTFSSFLRETLDPHLPAYSSGLQSVLFLLTLTTPTPDRPLLICTLLWEKLPVLYLFPSVCYSLQI